MDGRRWWSRAAARLAEAARLLRTRRAGPGRRFLGWIAGLVARRWLLPLLGAAVAWLLRAAVGRRRLAAGRPGAGRLRRAAGEGDRVAPLAMEIGREIVAESGGAESGGAAGEEAGSEAAGETAEAFRLGESRRAVQARVRIGSAEREREEPSGGPEES
ncbi:MAG: hypothetical protein QJR08_09405 [Bacillota bacterium]|nr:hypothetical protein [Bacillota bacterium]